MIRNAITKERLDRYHEDGYPLIQGMLDPQEIDLLGPAARKDRILDQHSYVKADGEGGMARLSLFPSGFGCRQATDCAAEDAPIFCGIFFWI